MSYTRKYREFLTPEKRVSRNNIRPRNIYRISTYRGSKPNTKTGDDSRYVFVIGKIGNKIHCIRLNDIHPIHFTGFLNKLRDKRRSIGDFQHLEALLKKYSKAGSDLFEQNVKHNNKIYADTKSTYRVYILEKIVNVWEIEFEAGSLKEMFGERDTPNTEQERKAVITEEINERDG